MAFIARIFVSNAIFRITPIQIQSVMKFSGQVILAYAIIYATVRFLIEFVRDDPRGDILGLTTLTGLSTSQMIGLVVGIGALITLILRWRRANASTTIGKAVTSNA
jgi:prolipoprotein diacylglyceryltransferase